MANTHHTGIPKLQWSFNYPPCSPAVYIAADVNPFCAGQTVTFTPTLVCLDDAVSYSWIVESVEVSTSSAPYSTNTLVGGNRVILKVVNSLGQSIYSNMIIVQEKTEGCITEIKYGLLYNPHAVQGTGGNSIISSIMDASGFTVAGSEDYKTLMLYIGGTDYGTYVRANSPIIDTIVDNTSFPYGSNTLGFSFRMAGSRSGEDGSFLEIDTYYGYLGTLDDYFGEAYKVFFVRHSPGYGIIYYATGVGELSNMGHPYRVVRAATGEEQLLDDGTACAPYSGNDGKRYRTVKIGTQVWLADNLAETKFRNGDYIHGYEGGSYQAISNAAWANLTDSALCAYNNDLNNV